MATGIKGITIDIGGNTAPLNKALADVNKTSRNLQNELKQKRNGLAIYLYGCQYYDIDCKKQKNNLDCSFIIDAINKKDSIMNGGGINE